jgi:hypothetical protein
MYEVGISPEKRVSRVAGEREMWDGTSVLMVGMRCVAS